MLLQSGARRGSWRAGWPALIVTAICRAVLTVTAGLLLWAVAPAVIGWDTTVVMSDSMSPALHTGDVVASRPVKDHQLRPGQVLLVKDPDHVDRLRLHRLVRVDDDGSLTLRGDANRGDDSTPVTVGAVQGVGALKIPFVGDVDFWLRTGQPARLVLFLVAAGAVVLGAFAYRPSEDAEDDDAEESDDDSDTDADPVDTASPARSGGGLRWKLLRPTSMTLIVAAGIAAIGAPVLAGTFGRTTANSANGWSAGQWVGVSCSAAVLADKPTLYYPLNDSSYSYTATDQSGNGADGTYQKTNKTTYGVTGPCRSGETGVGLDGKMAWIATPNAVSAPSSYTLETWFSTTTNQGGVLIGFGESQGAYSTTTDRQLYLNTAGQLIAGVGSSSRQVVTSPKAYNDGGWHQVAATYTAGSLSLYVDGTLVVSTTTGAPSSYTGYWHVGANSVNSWPSAPPNGFFPGNLAGVAIYPSALGAARIAAHYDARTS